MVFQTTYAMQDVILAWQMLKATDSALWIGLLAFTGGIPFLLGGPLTGILADRMNRQPLMAASAVLCALALGWLALLVGAGKALPWHIAGISFLTGWSYTFYVPARMALIPDLVPPQLVLNASMLDFSGGRVVGFLGPVVAGIVIERFGIAPGLWVVTALALAAIPFLLNAGPELTLRRMDSTERHTVSADLRQAIVWLKTDRALISVLVMGMVMVPVGLSWQKLMPVFTRDVLAGGASTLGLILGMSSLGAAISSIALAGTAPTFSIGRLILTTSALFGCLAILLAFVGNLYLVLFVAVCMGALSGTFLTLSNVAVQIHAPDELRGRVMGAWGMVWGLFPVGGLLAGALTEHWGVVIVIAGSGVICALFAIGMAIFAPQLRKV